VIAISDSHSQENEEEKGERRTELFFENKNASFLPSPFSFLIS